MLLLLFISFLKFLFIFREKGREGEREEEKHQGVVVSHMPPTGDLACNPGMWPDWDGTSDPLVHRPALNPLIHSNQGSLFISVVIVLIITNAYK